MYNTLHRFLTTEKTASYAVVNLCVRSSG